MPKQRAQPLPGSVPSKDTFGYYYVPRVDKAENKHSTDTKEHSFAECVRAFRNGGGLEELWLVGFVVVVDVVLESVFIRFKETLTA